MFNYLTLSLGGVGSSAIDIAHTKRAQLVAAETTPGELCKVREYRDF
tara:strand:- start:194 stop:334 length:141 start_codon:yes stop_codon:yes gene_type:complete